MSGEDFVVTTGIDTSGAKKGEQDFIASLNAIEQVATKFKRDLAGLFDPFLASVTDVRSQLATLTASFEALSAAPLKTMVADFTALGSSVERAAAATKAFSLAGITTQATSARTALQELEAAMNATTSRKPSSSLGNSSTANAGGATPAEAPVAGIASLMAVADAFGPAAARLQADVAAMAEALTVGTAAMRAFATASVSVRSALAKLQDGATAAIAPIAEIGASLGGLNVKFSGLQKAASDLLTLSTSANAIAASSAGLDQFATGITDIRTAVSRMSLANATKQLDALQASLANRAVLDAAAAAFDRLAASMSGISTVGATAFDALAARVTAVSTQVNQFVAAMNAVRADVFKTIASDVTAIGQHLSTATNSLLAFTTAANSITPSLATIAQNVKAIDFTALAKSAADALKPITAMSDQLERMSRSVNAVVNDFSRLNATVQNVYRNAQSAIGAASQAQNMPQQPTNGGNAGGSGFSFNTFATTQFRQGLRDLTDAAVQVSASLAHLGDMATNATGRFNSFSQIARGARLNLENIGGAAVSATTGVARLVASLAATTISAATSALASFASTLGHVATAMLGFQGLQSLANVFSPHAIAETADAWTNLDKRIQAVAKDQSEAAQMLSITTDLAQTFRLPLEEVTRQYVKLYEIQHPLGASLNDVKEELGGVLASLSRVGATASDVNSSLTQFTNLVATGNLTLQGLRSLLSHDPLLADQIAQATGKSMNQIRVELQKGGDAAKLVGAQVAGAIANIYKAGQGSFDAIPRSIADAFQQIKNQWLLTIGAIQKDTGFIDSITSALDKFRAALAGPEMQTAVRNIIEFGTTITTKMIEWTASLGSIPALFEKIQAAVANLGSLVANWTWDRITGDTSLKRLLDALNGPINAKQSVKDQSAFGDDPAKASTARVREGLDSLAKTYTFNVKTEFATPEAKASLQSFLDQSVTAGRSAAQSLAVAMSNDVRITPEGLASFDQGIEKLRLMQQQVRGNKISDQLKTDLGDTVETVRAQLTAASNNINNAINDNRIEITSLQAKLLELPPAWADSYREAQAVRDQIAAAKDRAAALAESATSAAAALKAMGGTDLAPLIAQLRAAASISIDPNRTIAVGENLKKPTVDRSANSGLDKIAKLKEELNLIQAEMSGDAAMIADAKQRLELEKLVTQAMKDGHQEQVAALTDLMQQKYALQKNLEWYKEFQSIGQQVGQTLENTFIAVGQGTMKWNDALKQTLAQMVKLIAEAMLIKPLINQMAAGFGQIGSGIGSAVGGHASQGLLGLGSGSNSSGGGLFGGGSSSSGGGLLGGMLGGGNSATGKCGCADVVSKTMGQWDTSVIKASDSWTTSVTSSTDTLGSSFTNIGADMTKTFDGIGSSLSSLFSGAGSGLSGMFAFKDGGAFGPGVRYFADGDIFDRPTGFTYGNGNAGILGEAGPEAIVPLSRGSDGKLGVKGGGGNVTHNSHVTINVAGDLTEATQRSLMAQMHDVVSQRTPGIVSHATTNVQRQNKRNPNFLKR